MRERHRLRGKFWQDLAKRVENIPGARGCLKKLRESFSAMEQGERVICLKEGPTYQKALDMLAADVEFMSLDAKLAFLGERRTLKRKEFWHSVFEETGIDEDPGLIFDPLNVRIVTKKTTNQPVSGSHKTSLDGYRDLIMAALVNPLNASKMIGDPRLRFCEIKRMAQAITEGDFKPALRSMIERWVEDPNEARESKRVLIEENMPEWLVEIATKLGQRRK